MNKRELRGLSYARTSTDGQVLDEHGNRKDDASPEAHKQRCESHAKHLSRKNNTKYKIIENISDEGYSGKNVKRPGFQRMCDLIETGNIDFVIAAELSRLSRSVLDFLEFVSHCEKYNTDIIIIGLDLDTSSPFGRMMLVILVALGQFEREITSERVKENVIARLLSDGKINGAAEVLGLVRDPDRKGHFVVEPEGLKQAERIMKLFLKFSSRAKVLEEAKRIGLSGKNGRELTGRMIDYILENAQWRYRGMWYANIENKGLDQDDLPPNQKYQTVKLSHGRVIDESLLDEVVEKLDDAKERNKKCGLKGYIYQFSNILVDEHGNSFKGYSSSGGKYRYYKNLKTGDRIRVDEIEPIILNRIKTCLINKDLFGSLVMKGVSKLKEDISKLDKLISDVSFELEELNQKEKKIKEKFFESSMDDEFTNWIKEQVQEIKKDKNEKNLRLNELEEIKKELIQENGVNYKNIIQKEYALKFIKSEGSQKRAILEKLINRVVVTENGMLKIEWDTKLGNLKKRHKKTVTLEDGILHSYENGGSEGTRTLDLRRDRPAL